MGIIIFLPVSSDAFVADDFVINRQSTYAVPYNAPNVLVFDLTLPAPNEGETLQLKSINLHNFGTADQTNISKLMIWEDGSSLGWDGDERSVVTLSLAPFFDTVTIGDFKKYTDQDFWQRIFVTVDTNETGSVERSFKIQLLKNSAVFISSSTGPTDAELTGFERKITVNDSTLSVPSSPIAGIPQAISSNTIRWYFTDIANNEFGFKLLDSSAKVLVKKEEANLSYIDEIGLQPNTEYSGRKVIAFNDRGENPVSVSSVFPSARTLALAPIVAPVSTTTEVAVEEPKTEAGSPSQEIITAPTLFETIQTKIADIQRQISELIKQLDELIKQSSATVFGALQGFLRAFFGK